MGEAGRYGWADTTHADDHKPGEQSSLAASGYAPHLPPSPGPALPPAPGAGYTYQATPDYPPPQYPPSPHRPRQHTPGWAWALISLLTVAVVVMGAVTITDQQRRPWDARPSAPATVDAAEDGYGQPNTSPAGAFTGEHLITRLNEALAARDRDAFFALVDGAAVEPLQLWWDNMAELGWSTSAISLQSPQRSQYSDDTITQQVLLGAVTAGSAQVPAGSGHPDAGLSYAPANRYRATIHVTDDGASGIIIGWEPQEHAAPWDLAPLHAAITEHAVIAGHQDETDLVERTAPAAEEAAAWVVASYREGTGVANTEQFLAFVTDDPDRFNSWFLDSDELDGWTGDRSGTMFPQWRPLAAPGIDPSIATGDRMTNAGGVVTLGPNGLQYGTADTTATLVHEFVHTIQQTNVPRVGGSSVVADEGWATYNESLFEGNGSYAPRLRTTGRTLRGCVQTMDGQLPREQDFADATEANCAYALSGSLYAYAASLGVDVHALADEALATGEPLWTLIERDGVPFTAESWSSWLRAQFG